MKLFIVAVRDRAADVYGQPMFVAHLGSAIRSFSDQVNNDSKDNVLFAHPEDFDLYELGTYDDNDGSFVSILPRQVAIGKDCRVAG